MNRNIITEIFSIAISQGYKNGLSKDRQDLLQIGMSADKTVLIAVITSKDFIDSFLRHFWELNKYKGGDGEYHYGHNGQYGTEEGGDYSEFDIFEHLVADYLSMLIQAIYEDSLDEFFTDILTKPIRRLDSF